MLLAALLFGGGPRGLGDLAVHLAALPAAALAALRWRTAERASLQRWVAWGWGGILLVLSLSLLPLPASVWGHGGPRADLLAGLTVIGESGGWRPWSLDPWGTARALLAVGTAFALWALLTTLGEASRRRLLMLAIGAGLAMALLGFAQAAAGAHSTLRPHAYHHPVGAIGLFANRNHFASLMGMLLPLTLALAARAQRHRRPSEAAVWYGAAVILMLAAALSFSRMGGALALLATLAAVPLCLRGEGRARRRLLAPISAVAVAAAGVAVYAWNGLAQRLNQDVAEDLRWQYLQYGWQAAKAYLPWGSGAGSFREVYAPFEPMGAMRDVHALHAHNDLLQVAIELGVPGLLLVAGLLAVLIVAVRKYRIADCGGREILTAAALAVSVPLVHSFVDYPLRTLAVATTFAMCMALITANSQRAQ
ncbi:hypothetical protein N800_04445 [Lysobacter daejeonensis GH1-9]|uniref:O-antigen ligase-related domain-containing protein n=1 Tax=Lysobacter daejeonensis GH1-9 TaxID=1385517 RepID=A0A0A0EVR9_9GAMM|nr:hypothetical protein N800_04445 [Lysobacter daejeonensis GH1-9]